MKQVLSAAVAAKILSIVTSTKTLSTICRLARPLNYDDSQSSVSQMIRGHWTCWQPVFGCVRRRYTRCDRLFSRDTRNTSTQQQQQQQQQQLRLSSLSTAAAIVL